MKNPLKLLRSFSTDDAKMIQFSRTTKINLENNLAEFTAFDPDFDANFLTQYETAIDQAEVFNSDNQLIDVQVQATLDLEEKMTECRDFFQIMKYFIEKAFPGKRGTWDEFGYNDYDRVRNRSTSMIQFMHDLFEVATKYASNLESVGFDAARLATIETLTNELREAKSLQEQTKGVRSTAANDRVVLLNKVWDLTTRICNAGKAVFYKDYGRYQLFLLPWRSGSSSVEIGAVYTGVVHGNDTLHIDIPDLTSSTVLVLTNTGPVPLRFHGEQHPGEDSGGGIIINPHDSQSVTFENIANHQADAQVLNVSHKDPAPHHPDGSYEVIITE